MPSIATPSRSLMLNILTPLVALALLLLAQPGRAADFRDGDIIFQQSRSSQSLAIQKATGSKYSHMGLVIYRSGFPQVFEASGKVGYTPLEEWRRRGVGGHYVLKRLRNAGSILNGEMLSKMRRTAEEFRGKPYDPYFEWSDTRMYCSELVWKIYYRALGLEIGRTQRLKELNLSVPVVKKALAKRFGANIPLKEKVITPAAMFESKLLVTVEEG